MLPDSTLVNGGSDDKGVSVTVADDGHLHYSSTLTIASLTLDCAGAYYCLAQVNSTHQYIHNSDSRSNFGNFFIQGS